MEKLEIREGCYKYDENLSEEENIRRKDIFDKEYERVYEETYRNNSPVVMYFTTDCSTEEPEEKSHRLAKETAEQKANELAHRTYNCDICKDVGIIVGDSGDEDCICEDAKRQAILQRRAEQIKKMESKNVYRCALCRDTGLSIGEYGVFEICCEKKVEKPVPVDLIPDNRKKDKFRVDVLERRKELNEAVEYKGKKRLLHGFEDYLSVLSTLSMKIHFGKRVEKSYLIGAPVGHGKATWVHECLKRLHGNGYKAVPYISGYELYNLLESSYFANNVKDIAWTISKKNEELGKVLAKIKEVEYKESNVDRELLEEYEERLRTLLDRFWSTNTPYSFRDYERADLVFLHIGSNEMLFKMEMPAVTTLLDTRGRRGLPTIIMTDRGMGWYKNNEKYGKRFFYDYVLLENQSLFLDERERDIRRRHKGTRLLRYVNCYYK